ncbi:MAG: hypothetical protein ABS84_01925 [Rubrivivax sp. SCN 71-131]|nr:MAG: hypothetical protein ABS84_01925 [Rubrivivax sp. SCN 71-131]
MRRAVLPLLLLANLGLALWLAALWFTPEGRLADLRWQPPPPLPPVLDAGAPLPATGVELSRYVATLEQPLFSPSRRAPPPPQAASAAPVADAPPELRVLGLYGTHATEGEASGGPRGGMIARVDGQVKRVKIGDAIGRWTLKALRPGEAVLAQGDVEHVYPLQRAASTPPPPDAASADNPPREAPSASTPRTPAANPYYQRQVDEARANVRRVNALRARSGLPPLPEP